MIGRLRPSRLRSETIDQVVAKKEEARRAQVGREEQRRFDFAKRLGDRAMKGEPFGLKGFLGIGFPNLTPESKKYQEILRAYFEVKLIPPGKCISVGENWTNVFGIKANAGDNGIAFEVKPWSDGNYYVRAKVLCSRALYSHNPASGTMYGSEEEPYGVDFIDSSISDVAKPVREILLGSYNLAGYDRYVDGTRANSEPYTRRLTSEPIAL